ncbi:hypothetical protein EVAR_16418_1 [Eumeta japonica]|uniref:Uncharacterized protein n=1 Tax=Eumeta variegata TaxID=151549 RepID=A0A4C1UK73_EUMVA|nr:hypothetical protein EVAR_16418_1 [Eumeta japonica]
MDSIFGYEADQLESFSTRSATAECGATYHELEFGTANATHSALAPTAARDACKQVGKHSAMRKPPGLETPSGRAGRLRPPQFSTRLSAYDVVRIQNGGDHSPMTGQKVVTGSWLI